MSDPQRPIRLHEHMAAMVALEHHIERQLQAFLGQAAGLQGGAALVDLLARSRDRTRAQREALRERLRAIAPSAVLPELRPPVLPLQDHIGDAHPVSAALLSLHALYNETLIGYALLMELANRAADNAERLGPTNTAELARQHMRAYASVVREIVRRLPFTLVDELEGDGAECQCICPGCGLGVCLCAVAFRRQLALAWSDAGPIDEMAGIEMVRPRDGSAAARAGVEKGDVLIAVDGAPIDSIPKLQEAIRRRSAGEEMTFEVRRGSGERAEVRVTRQ